MTSNDFFETEFGNCLQIIKEMCTTTIKVVENTIFPIDYVEEMEVKMHKNSCVTHLQKWIGFLQ